MAAVSEEENMLASIEDLMEDFPPTMAADAEEENTPVSLEDLIKDFSPTMAADAEEENMPVSLDDLIKDFPPTMAEDAEEENTPVSLADLIKILDPARSKLDDRGLAHTTFPEISEECRGCVEKAGYDSLVKVLLDCEVQHGAKVHIDDVAAALQQEPLNLSNSESRAVANALHKKA
eukprot:CAMPEP_0180129572 /NCGR_PEP_ID=MMETSP0986-20121125/7382_1 /TAXON_ID=697907 /ORGANISM="non described non described, Strain CCMP2293" /LENGTH=176 /DNA_ID=CAMNT_0022069239 /DNA_START=147 /DNA_END=677 /DNA_ORIENTATION=+